MNEQESMNIADIAKQAAIEATADAAAELKEMMSAGKIAEQPEAYTFPEGMRLIRKLVEDIKHLRQRKFDLFHADVLKTEIDDRIEDVVRILLAFELRLQRIEREFK